MSSTPFHGLIRLCTYLIFMLVHLFSWVLVVDFCINPDVFYHFAVRAAATISTLCTYAPFFLALANVFREPY